MRAPLPRLHRIATASSMEVYFIEHWARSRSSLTLTPSGDDRSTINRHLSGRLCLGITPTGLSMKEGRERTASSEKQATRCRLTSCARYLSMMSGCSYADRSFLEDSQQRVPLWNPKRNPDMKLCCR